MAILLLILVMTSATLKHVLADDYTETIACDGISWGGTRYCRLKSIGRNDIGYYQIELIQGQGCGQNTYALVRENLDVSRASVSVRGTCNGTFGIKPKVAGFPYRGKCGQDNYAGFRIINGRYAKTCQFPWMALVKLYWKSGYRTTCGGSIINDRWILTAGHCVIKQHGNGKFPPYDTVTVRTGSLDKSDNYIERSVDRMIKHPGYNHTSLRNDVFLLRLVESIKWDGCHAPVCLNTNTNVNDSVDLSCVISGWGRIQNPDVWPQELRWEYDRILPRSECDQVYGFRSTDYTLCGRANSGGFTGFCLSDSGGPLVCKSRQDGRYYQHGVVSLYLANRICSMQGLYSNVAAYMSWIRGYVPDV